MSLSDYSIVLIICIVLTAPLDIFLKLNVYKNYSRFFKAVFVPAVFFIIWDIFATHWGHWTFSKQHVSTIRILGLPIEEYLFFIIVPLCAILSLEAIRKLNPKTSNTKTHISVWAIFIALYLVAGIVISTIFNNSNDIQYPSRDFPFYGILTTIVFSVFIFIVLRNKETRRLISQYDYFLTILICLIFMIFINGYLTELTDPIVTYGANFGPRIFFNIPIEDFFYGSVLLLWTMINYDKLKGRDELDNS